MIARTAALVTWLLVGHAVLGGLYWALLQVPESNVFMLTASALLVLAMILWTGVVEQAGILASDPKEGLRTAVRSAISRSWLVVLPLLIFGFVWWLTWFAEGWFAAHNTEIDAWLILKTGRTETGGLHSTIAWAIWFVRYPLGVSLALSLLASTARLGTPGVVALAWLRRAFSWRQLPLVAVMLLAGIWLPWQWVDWRPKNLPPTWVQPAFAGAKLFALYVVATVAWAVILRTVARPRAPAPAGRTSDGAG